MVLFEGGAFAGDTVIMERREDLELFNKLLTKNESLLSKNKTIVNT